MKYSGEVRGLERDAEMEVVDSKRHPVTDERGGEIRPASLANRRVRSRVPPLSAVPPVPLAFSF